MSSVGPFVAICATPSVIVTGRGINDIGGHERERVEAGEAVVGQIGSTFTPSRGNAGAIAGDDPYLGGITDSTRRIHVN